MVLVPGSVACTLDWHYGVELALCVTAPVPPVYFTGLGKGSSGKILSPGLSLRPASPGVSHLFVEL